MDCAAPAALLLDWAVFPKVQAKAPRGRRPPYGNAPDAVCFQSSLTSYSSYTVRESVLNP